MTCRLALASVTLLALAGPASAAEILGGFVDIRLGAGVTGGDYNINDDILEADDTTTTSTRLTLDWIGSLGIRKGGGWLWGIGFAFGADQGEIPIGLIQGDAYQIYHWAVTGHLGYGWAFTERVQLEILPWVGVGRAHMYTEVNDSADGAVDGYREGGVNVNLMYTWPNGFQVGGNLGLIVYDTEITNFNVPGNVNGGTQYHYLFTTWKAGVSIGWRL